MLEKSFSILFYLKKPKGYVKGAIPIYMRITVDCVPKEMTTKHECDPERWNSEAQRAKGTNETSKSLNSHLDLLERQVHEARKRLIESQTSITAAGLKSILTGQADKPRMLLELFAEHNKKLSTLVGKEFALGTLKRYDTTLEHVRAFLKFHYNCSDVSITSLDFAFASNFEFYLKTQRNCNHNSTMKYIGNMRKIVNYCLKSGWLQKDPFFGYKMAKKEVIREYLTDTELQAIKSKVFSIDRLNQVRDIFVFSCYTGLAYIDVFQLTPNQIGRGIDGNLWIFTNRQKTNTPSRIPLLPQAQEIIERYKANPKCICEGKILPVVSNQKMNAYLKEIADVCGITKKLTFHIARHTFATTITLSNGVPIETVSKMLGHRDIKITQHYAKILDKKISEDMIILNNKLSMNMNGTS